LVEVSPWPRDLAGFDLVAQAQGFTSEAAKRSPYSSKNFPSTSTYDDGATTRMVKESAVQMTPPPRFIRSAVAVTDFLGYGVATREWKLLYYPRQDEGFLFHRASDPSDRINRFTRVAGEADDAKVTSIMLRALLRWRARLLPASSAGRPMSTTLSGEGGSAATKMATRQFSRSSSHHDLRGTDAELSLMHDLKGF